MNALAMNLWGVNWSFSVTSLATAFIATSLSSHFEERQPPKIKKPGEENFLTRLFVVARFNLEAESACADADLFHLRVGKIRHRE